MLENTDDLEIKKASIDEKSMPEPSIIPVEVMSGLGKLAKIINNSDDNLSYKMKDDEVEIRFDRPVYISEISLTLGTFDNVKGMRLIASDILTSKQVKLSITVENISGPAVRFLLGKVVTSFSIKKESYFSKDIKNIKISGIFLNELEKFESEYKNLKEFKLEILKLLDEKTNFFKEKFLALANDRATIEIETKTAEEVISALNSEGDKLNVMVD